MVGRGISLHCLGITIDAREQNSARLVIVDQEDERMITLEFGWLHWPGRTEADQDCSRRRCAALLIDLDFGHVLGVAERQLLLGAEVVETGGRTENLLDAQLTQDLRRVNSFR